MLEMFRRWQDSFVLAHEEAHWRKRHSAELNSPVLSLDMRQSIIWIMPQNTEKIMWLYVDFFCLPSRSSSTFFHPDVFPGRLAYADCHRHLVGFSQPEVPAGSRRQEANEVRVLALITSLPDYPDGLCLSLQSQLLS